MKSSLSEDKIKEVVGDEVDSLIKQVDDTLEWFENNQDAKKEEYETRMKELESVINPVMQKVYQQQAAQNPGGMPGGMPTDGTPMPQNETSEPVVEEVD